MLRGLSEQGDPVDIVLEICWRCGLPVSTFHVPMDEHVDRMHPTDDDADADAVGRHFLR
jgi:hypothetical protein